MGKGRDLGRRVRRPQSVDEKLKAAKRKDEKKLKINRQGTLDFHLNAQPAQRKKCGACDAADVEVEDSLCKGCEAAIIAAEASRGSSSADASSSSASSSSASSSSSATSSSSSSASSGSSANFSKVTTSALVPAPGPTAPTPPVPRAFSPPARPLPMPPAKTVDLEARESVVVGGNWIDYGTEDGSADSANDIGGAAKKKKGNGERGGDRKPRAKRSCSRCKHNKGANANDCNGRGAVARCQYFTEQNAPIPQT